MIAGAAIGSSLGWSWGHHHGGIILIYKDKLIFFN